MISRRAGSIAPMSIMLILIFPMAVISWENSTVPKADGQLAQKMVFEGNSSQVYSTEVDLVANKAVVFKTLSLSKVSDPVLHLLDSSKRQVAVNDDRQQGDKGSELSYVPTVSGKYTLILRSKTQESHGIADILMNGMRWKSGVSFGGWHIQLLNIRAGEEIHSIAIPNGSIARPIPFMILKSDGIGIETYVIDGGSSGGSLHKATADLGTRLVIPAVGSSGMGDLRIVRNDAAIAGHDPDGDNLGTELESALGTCSAPSGIATGPDGKRFDCRRITDARDTDGDGIRDGWEVLGITKTWRSILTGGSQKTETLSLPLWGANPRHKDLFMEVDFMKRTLSESPQRLSPNIARQFASFYQDEIGTLTEGEKSRHAVSLQNPDGLPGISVHMDTGVAPERPSDSSLYGNWGGYNAVAPVRKPDGTWGGADFTTAWRTEMSVARFGVFRYELFYGSGGGQVPLNSFALSGPGNNAWVLTHESAHGMGLGHSGPAHLTGWVDVNCKPNYPSLINYAFSDGSVSFSDGRNAPDLNNNMLSERNAVSPSNLKLLDVLENRFRYYVDKSNGHVDWNRNGFFEEAGRKVAAYANYAPGGACEFTRYNQMPIRDSASIQTPALARLGDRVYVFYLHKDSGDIRYRFTDSDFSNCKKPIRVAPCVDWSITHSVGRLGFGPAKGFDVAELGNKLILVAIDSSGKLKETQLSLSNGGLFGIVESWSKVEQISMGASTIASGEPSILTGPNFAYLAYKDDAGRLYYKHRSIDSTWGSEMPMTTLTNTQLIVHPSTSPSLSLARLAWKPATLEVYGAFSDPSDGKLDIWWLNSSSGKWTKTNVLERRPGPIAGKPAMAFVSYSYCCNSMGGWVSQEEGGRLYLIFADSTTDPTSPGFFKMMMSYTKVTTAGGKETRSSKVGLLSYFDNSWYGGYGVDLLSDYPASRSLFAAVALGDGSTEYEVYFRPNADGILDYRYSNYDDWSELGVKLCQNVVNPGGLVSDPVKCPATGSRVIRADVIPSEAGTSAFSVEVLNRTFDLVITSESPIGAVNFDQEGRKIAIELLENETSGPMQIEIPKEFLSGNFTVFADDVLQQDVDVIDTATSTTILLEPPIWSRIISIQGTNVVPEFPWAVLLLIVLLMFVVAVTRRSAFTKNHSPVP